MKYRDCRWERSVWVITMSVFYHYGMDWVYWEDIGAVYVLN